MRHLSGKEFTSLQEVGGICVYAVAGFLCHTLGGCVKIGTFSFFCLNLSGL